MVGETTRALGHWSKNRLRPQCGAKGNRAYPRLPRAGVGTPGIPRGGGLLRATWARSAPLRAASVVVGESSEPLTVMATLPKSWRASGEGLPKAVLGMAGATHLTSVTHRSRF